MLCSECKLSKPCSTDESGKIVARGEKWVLLGCSTKFTYLSEMSEVTLELELYSLIILEVFLRDFRLVLHLES